jgi:protein gp37
MGDKSKIEWTDATWSPVTGCSKISAGCHNCYAERMAKRLKAMGQHRYRNGFDVTLHEDILDRPIRWTKPRMIFVCSMSDLFHKDVPAAFIRRVFDAMVEAPQHTYQVLTKRSERLVAMAPHLPWPKHVWAGVTVENGGPTHRISHLQEVPSAVRFLSMEPLLGPMPRVSLNGIHWVIVGGESGPRARPIEKAWVREIRDRCIGSGVPFFFKQWGGVNKKKAGKVLDGRTWEEMPRVTK